VVRFRAAPDGHFHRISCLIGRERVWGIGDPRAAEADSQGWCCDAVDRFSGILRRLMELRERARHAPLVRNAASVERARPLRRARQSWRSRWSILRRTHVDDPPTGHQPARFNHDLDAMRIGAAAVSIASVIWTRCRIRDGLSGRAKRSRARAPK